MVKASIQEPWIDRQRVIIVETEWIHERRVKGRGVGLLEGVRLRHWV